MQVVQEYLPNFLLTPSTAFVHKVNDENRITILQSYLACRPFYQRTYTPRKKQLVTVRSFIRPIGRCQHPHAVVIPIPGQLDPIVFVEGICGQHRDLMALRDKGTAQTVHDPWNAAISPGRGKVRSYLKDVHRTLTERE